MALMAEVGHLVATDARIRKVTSDKTGSLMNLEQGIIIKTLAVNALDVKCI